MKRFLSLILALCLITTGMLSLSACGHVTKRDLTKDPYTTLNSALQNTLSAFFTDDAGIGKILEKAQKKGSMGVALKSEELLSTPLSLSTTIYTDAKKDLLMADVDLDYLGKDISAFLWSDKDGVGLKSESLLGTPDALRLNYASFEEKFEDSDLCKILNMDGAVAGSPLSILKQAMETMQTSTKKLEDEGRDLVNRVFEALDQSVAKEDVAMADGKKVSHLVTVLSLTDANLRAVCEIIKEELNAEESFTSEEKESWSNQLDEIADGLDETMDLNITLKIYVLPKKNRITKITLEGKLTSSFGVTDVLPLGESSSASSAVELDASLDFSATEIALDVDMVMDGRDVSFDVAITKETDKKSVTYELSATAGLLSVTVDLLNATFTYEKSTGDITLELDVMQTESSRNKITVGANLKVEKNAFALSLSSAKLGNKTINFGKQNVISITVKALDTLPSIPNKSTDIMNLIEDEWMEIIEHIGTLFVQRLSGTYSASLMGLTDIVYSFDEDQVTVTTNMAGAYHTYEGTYYIMNGSIELYFPENDLLSGSFGFRDNGNAIVIEGVTYEKVVN